MHAALAYARLRPSTNAEDVLDRRKYRRIHAPLYCRPAGMSFLARQREPVDVSLGGVRIYSDEHLRVGMLLKMEFFLPDVPAVTYTAEVVWIDALPRTIRRPNTTWGSSSSRSTPARSSS